VPARIVSVLEDMRESLVAILVTVISVLGAIHQVKSHEDQPLSGIAVHKITFGLNEKAYVKASPTVLGSNVIITILFLYFSSLLMNY